NEANLISCTNCNNKIKPDSKFCPECGNKVSVIEKAKFCSECGTKSEGEAKFCLNCGNKL
ncbi:MAG: zinc-ribbon domain-containing protein, partial [Clostridium sp.]